MREGWARGRAEVELGLPAVRRLVAVVLPGTEAVESTPVPGGLANTNLKVRLRGSPEFVLLRIYQRDPGQGGKEAALHRLLAGRVPVPQFRSPPARDGETGFHFAVVEWMEGERLEQVLPGLDAAARRRMGEAVGNVLAAIHAVTFPASGFFAPDLSVASAGPGGRSGLLGFLRRCLVDGPGGDRLGAADTAAVLAFAEREGDRLEAWEGSPCLTHGDFNGSNLLVANGRVTAVLDWEFAFSGGPAFDFASLLRPPTGEAAPFIEGVAAGYRSAGGYLPPGWRRIARIADLYAWADFLARPAAGPDHALWRDAAGEIRKIVSGR